MCNCLINKEPSSCISLFISKVNSVQTYRTSFSSSHTSQQIPQRCSYLLPTTKVHIPTARAQRGERDKDEGRKRTVAYLFFTVICAIPIHAAQGQGPCNLRDDIELWSLSQLSRGCFSAKRSNVCCGGRGRKRVWTPLPFFCSVSLPASYRLYSILLWGSYPLCSAEKMSYSAP